MKFGGTRLHRLAWLGLGLCLATASAAHAVDPVNSTLFGDLAIHGYDPVAYFRDGRAVEGSKAFTLRWRGANWRFRSERHREAFREDPERYAPQFGGYCAWAVAHGYTADVDPEAWKIVDGRLYLNYSRDIQAKWDEDPSRYIRQGQTNWPRMLRAR